MWAHRDLNPEPADYESVALTVELWALLSSDKYNILFFKCKYLFHRVAFFSFFFTIDQSFASSIQRDNHQTRDHTSSLILSRIHQDDNI